MIAAGFLCFLSQADVRQSKQVGEANRTRGCQSAGVSDDVSGHFVVHGAGPSPPSPSIAPSLPLSPSVSLCLSLGMRLDLGQKCGLCVLCSFTLFRTEAAEYN